MPHNSVDLHMPDNFWDTRHPHRLWTWLRVHMPGPISDFFPKATDCTTSGGWHRWYNKDELHSVCYHCKVIIEGQLWRQQPSQPGVQA